MGISAGQSSVGFIHHPHQLAGAAQSHSTNAACRRTAIQLWSGFRLQLAFRVGHGVSDHGHSWGRRCGLESRAVRSCVWTDHKATRAGRSHAGSRARSRLCDELLRCDCDVRSRFCGHGRAVSDVQLSAWFLGSFPYRKRHVCECAVWHTANRDGHKTRYESDPDGFRKLCRRRDGKDDQPDQHCRCRCRNDNEAGR